MAVARRGLCHLSHQRLGVAQQLHAELRVALQFQAEEVGAQLVHGAAGVHHGATGRIFRAEEEIHPDQAPEYAAKKAVAVILAETVELKVEQ